MEVELALLLPTWLQRGRPLRVGRLIVSHVDRRRCALKNIEVLGIPAQVRNQLYACRAGADKRDTLVMQLVQTAVSIPPCVVVVPTGRVEHMALEILDPWDTGQLRSVEVALRHDDEAGTNVVTAIRTQPPAFDRFIPAHGANLGGQDRAVVEPEMLCDAPAVLV